MTPRKAFFTAFFISLSIVLSAYSLLYFAIENQTDTASTPKQGVAISTPLPDDTRTILLEAGNKTKFYFLIKFNRIQSKISIVSISPSYVYPSCGRSLSQSRQRAGIMQCVLDTKEEFGINIDYYISCSWQQAGRIIPGFRDFGTGRLGRNLPPVVKKFLLENAEKIDIRTLINALDKAEYFLRTDTGLAFLNETAYILLSENGENLYENTSGNFRKIYSTIETNINTEDLQKLERILKFLSPAYTTYCRNIITAQDPSAHRKISRAILE